jgi:hypothetical protein
MNYEAFIWFVFHKNFVWIIYLTQILCWMYTNIVLNPLYTNIMQNIPHVKIMAFTKDQAHQFVRLPHWPALHPYSGIHFITCLWIFKNLFDNKVCSTYAEIFSSICFFFLTNSLATSLIFVELIERFIIFAHLITEPNP